MKLDVVVLIALAMLLAAYCTFVFTSESLNPFVKPKPHFRRRAWHLGRHLAGAIIIAVVLVALCFATGVLAWQQAALLGFAVWLILSVMLSYRYRHRA